MVPAIVVTMLVVSLFFGTYIMNKRTPEPLEAEEIVDKESCTACMNYSCRYKIEETRGD